MLEALFLMNGCRYTAANSLTACRTAIHASFATLAGSARIQVKEAPTTMRRLVVGLYARRAESPFSRLRLEQAFKCGKLNLKIVAQENDNALPVYGFDF